MCILHISEYLTDLIATILTLNIIGKSFSMASNLTDESIPRPLENQTDAKVRIILLLLQTSFRQPDFISNIALLLHCQLITHRFKHTYLTDD